jgi:hypothetical protein
VDAAAGVEGHPDRADAGLVERDAQPNAFQSLKPIGGVVARVCGWSGWPRSV